MRFTHVETAQRLYFGSGEAAVNLATEISRLAADRILLITEAAAHAQARRLTAGLGVRAEISEVVAHVPLMRAQAARELAAREDIDLVVTVGGGSATGLGKAVALTTALPVVAVPTTYAGSEATTAWGITHDGRKDTGVDPRVLPVAVIADPLLCAGLPLDISIMSGLNAAAHCVDSFWAPDADPVTSVLAGEGLAALVVGLRELATGREQHGRERCLFGAYLSARAFSAAGSGLHHKICHALGGAYDLPHAATHTVVLPYVLAYNLDAAPDARCRIGSALSLDADAQAGAVLAGWVAFVRGLGVPTSLRELGLAETELAEAAALIAPTVPSSNPRPVGEADLRDLLRAAWLGTDPELTAPPQQKETV